MLHDALTKLPLSAAMAATEAIEMGAKVADDPAHEWDMLVELSHVPTKCWTRLREAGFSRVGGTRRRWVFLKPADADTVYVSMRGSDETGDGSSGKPFKTICRASRSSGPGPVTRIYVSAGCYDVRSFFHGKNRLVSIVGSNKGPTILFNGGIR